MDQFNKLNTGYSSFVGADPMRNGLHYPAVLQKLGETQQGVRRKVLDVGCGDGLLARMLASDPYKAQVTGFDSSPNFVTLAQQEEERQPLGIQYEVASADQFKTSEHFDDAVSVMVLPYAPDATYLRQFFRAACEPLKEGSRFVSVVFNPEFKAFGVQIGNRMFTKTDDGRVQVHFLHPETKETTFTSHLTQFSKGDYEEAAKESGFKKVSWEALHPTHEAVEKLGETFWEACDREQPYAVLVTEK